MIQYILEQVLSTINPPPPPTGFPSVLPSFLLGCPEMQSLHFSLHYQTTQLLVGSPDWTRFLLSSITFLFSFLFLFTYLYIFLYILYILYLMRKMNNCVLDGTNTTSRSMCCVVRCCTLQYSLLSHSVRPSTIIYKYNVVSYLLIVFNFKKNIKTIYNRTIYDKRI